MVFRDKDKDVDSLNISEKLFGIDMSPQSSSSQAQQNSGAYGYPLQQQYQQVLLQQQQQQQQQQYGVPQMQEEQFNMNTNSQQENNSKEALNAYIYDFLYKSSLLKTANTFYKESDIQEDGYRPAPPTHQNTPGFDGHSVDKNAPSMFTPKHSTPQGFLFEWWQIYWDLFNVKTQRGGSDLIQQYFQDLIQEQRQEQIYKSLAVHAARSQHIAEQKGAYRNDTVDPIMLANVVAETTMDASSAINRPPYSHNDSIPFKGQYNTGNAAAPPSNTNSKSNNTPSSYSSSSQMAGWPVHNSTNNRNGINNHNASNNAENTNMNAQGMHNMTLSNNMFYLGQQYSGLASNQSSSGPPLGVAKTHMQSSVSSSSSGPNVAARLSSNQAAARSRGKASTQPQAKVPKKKRATSTRTETKTNKINSTDGENTRTSKSVKSKSNLKSVSAHEKNTESMRQVSSDIVDTKNTKLKTSMFPSSAGISPHTLMSPSTLPNGMSRQAFDLSGDSYIKQSPGGYLSSNETLSVNENKFALSEPVTPLTVPKTISGKKSRSVSVSTNSRKSTLASSLSSVSENNTSKKDEPSAQGEPAKKKKPRKSKKSQQNGSLPESAVVTPVSNGVPEEIMSMQMKNANTSASNKLLSGNFKKGNNWTPKSTKSPMLASPQVIADELRSASTSNTSETINNNMGPFPAATGTYVAPQTNFDSIDLENHNDPVLTGGSYHFQNDTSNEMISLDSIFGNASGKDDEIRGKNMSSSSAGGNHTASNAAVKSRNNELQEGANRTEDEPFALDLLDSSKSDLNFLNWQ